MTATILDGRAIADRIKTNIQQELAKTISRPALAILSFQSPASETYRRAQEREARSLLIGVTGQHLSTQATQETVEHCIEEWNQDEGVHGIFVHQPMPSHIDPQRISGLIDPRKDIEGIHPQNSARRFFAKARIGSCTALAVMALIESTGEELGGKEAVVVGHSEIVGRPVSMLLLDQLATTTVCHVGTRNLEDHVRRADILVVAVGKPKLIKGEWVKPGSTVIDVGITVDYGKVIGDVEFEAAKDRAKYISPVPGGVGPVTVMMVMKNTIEAWKLQQHG